MEWVERLRLVIGKRQQKDFAAWAGVSPARLNNYLQKRHELPEADFLITLARKGINVNWLLTGDGEIYTQASKPHPITEEMQILIRELSDTPAMVPLLTDIVRNAKDVKKADDKTNSAFEGLKQAIGKKPKRPHGSSS